MSGVVALTAWRDPVATAVLRAKLTGRREVMAALGDRLGAMVEGPVAAVVPVPTVPGRARRRGADHALVLARAVSRRCGQPVVRALRTGRVLPDRGRSAAHRAPVPTDAFRPAPAVRRVDGRTVLLVDDVLTTGGTLAASARVLGRAGVVDVRAAVVARAGHHQLGA